MSFTLTDTNFNGSVSDFIFMDLAEGNEVITKGAAYLETGVRTKKELPLLSQSLQPLGTYVASPVTGDETMTTDYDKRDLEVSDVMLYEEFNPNDFIGLWDKWGSTGPFTELILNPEFLRDIMLITSANAGAHISQLFWQGDKLSIDPKLALIDGILTTAGADANTVKATPAGVITKANIISILKAVIDLIPDKYFETDLFKIALSVADYRLLQRANTELKENFDGALNDTFKNMLDNKTIVPFVGMKKDHVLATVMTADESSNLVLGFWFDETQEFENVRVNRIANNSDDWFMRINLKLGAQYRYSPNVILYEPA